VNPIFQSLDEKQIMGLTICREAGGEPDEGKVAVGTVILERVDHRAWDGNNVKEVCLMKWQFSCYNEHDKGYGKTLHMAEQWDQCFATDFSLMNCYSLAVGMLSGIIPRHPILAAAHCCQYLNPRWAPKTKSEWLESGMKVILAVGHHEFFV
jgi:hypothetical protein